MLLWITPIRVLIWDYITIPVMASISTTNLWLSSVECFIKTVLTLNYFLSLSENTSWHSATDSRGAYLFDRSPDYFEPILNFLRHGRLIINPTVNSEGVLEEAKFFGVTKVIEQLEPIVEVIVFAIL